MTAALVNPDLLRWARERAHLAVDVLAHKVGTRAEKVAAWETGDMRPTFKQAQKIAHAVHVPFGYLFLPMPPEEALPIPDFRTPASRFFRAPSADLLDVLQDIKFKQDWYRDYLRQQGADALPFIGRFTIQNPVEYVARQIAATLEVTEETRRGAGSWEDYLRTLVRKAETAGIWVMITGTVAGNTHRPLSVDEFRGFAISDAYAPLIFINGKDAKAAQIFTLAHELAHLWIGADGISSPELGNPGYQDLPAVERYCNQVAAEFLLPADSFLRSWTIGTDELDLGVQNLARHYRVSRVVVARRAYDLHLLDWHTYQDFYAQEVERWRREQSGGEGGGDYYFSANVRNGERYTRTVLLNALSGRLLLRDAGRLLNVSPAKLKPFAAKFNLG
jgi:Zn-dependent peptidase ImmA (M78 family)/DNA-binding XRE family transcriptional regulator